MLGVQRMAWEILPVDSWTKPPTLPELLVDNCDATHVADEGWRSCTMYPLTPVGNAASLPALLTDNLTGVTGVGRRGPATGVLPGGTAMAAAGLGAPMRFNLPGGI